MISSDIQIQISIRFTPQSTDYGYGRSPTAHVQTSSDAARVRTNSPTASIRTNTDQRDVVKTALEDAMDIMNQVNMADVQYGYHLGDLETQGVSSRSPLYPAALVETPDISPALRPEEVILYEMEKNGSLVNTSA